MATLLLSAVGGALGGAIGGGVFGISSVVIGRALGSVVGSAIDQSIASSLITSKQQGPKLEQATITGSTEGAPVTRLQGRARLSGQIVWATRFEEEVTTTRTGGKGGGPKVSTTTYSYFANFAVALCEGPSARIGRIWADGTEIDQTRATIRAYPGTEDQLADALIVAKEGAEAAPAFRGLAYVVFERLPIETYGNRIPQITVEVYRPVGALEAKVPGVCLIPGATEFGYDPEEVTAEDDGTTTTVNRHSLMAGSDWAASLDLLGDLAPNCTTVMLVVAWFGDDLRAGACRIVPRVAQADLATFKGSASHPWAAAGLTRDSAEVCSSDFTGHAAYGGTPTDDSVIAAIQDLKARGYEVLLNPFVLMDIAAGNTLPTPYSDDAATSGQPAYPWRGQITVSPAAGFAGTADGTTDAANQVETFFTRSDGYAAFVLHLAGLADQAGGVDAFLIGSELVGLTRARDDTGAYPAVARLQSLAADVRGVLGSGTKIGYAADWSEYHSHRPADGSGDVHFHLDPLWADPEIDFIGIDNYLPVTDWRDGGEHLDAEAGWPSIHDPGYLDAGIEGGEDFDWFYASDADRAAQVRTPITDGAYAKPWVYRQKDITAWWESLHYDRPGGVEAGSPTGWTPGAKPIWFTELGCPAVDKGANQPNVFVDPKSAESALPRFSTGARDDAMQRAFLDAHLDHWAGSAMVERILVWCWDARPAPSFPQEPGFWGDASNWHRGHWISGRLGQAPARETVLDLFARAGFADHDVRPIGSVVDAVISTQLASPRSMIEALDPVHNLMAVESGATLRIASRSDIPAPVTLDPGALVRGAGEGVEAYTRKRAQETDLPAALTLSWGEPTADDRPAAYAALRVGTASTRTAAMQLPVVMSDAKGTATAERLLRDLWWGRETLDAMLPPSMLALEPGDLIRLGSGTEAFRLTEIGEGSARQASASRVDPTALNAIAAPGDAEFRSRKASRPTTTAGRAVFAFLDIPLLADDDAPFAPYLAARATPWRDGTAFWRSASDAGYALDTRLTIPAGIGTLLADLPAGPTDLWDEASEIVLSMKARQLVSAEDAAVLAGANALAVAQVSGEWEILQFASAELIGPNSYRLTRLLRGQLGSEHAIGDPCLAGARVVVLDPALQQAATGASELGLPLNWRIGPAALDVGDPIMVQESVTLRGIGARPYAPVHLAGALADGDWQLGWVRRSRIGGDSWDLVEVPLGEEVEAYRVDILDPTGVTLWRSVEVGAPAFIWSAAMQAADTGGAAGLFRLRVAQLSATFGAGIATTALIGD